MNTNPSANSTLDNLSSTALAARLDELMTRERHCLCAILLHLAALDRRRGHLELGYGSLFVFCTDRLKMSKATAYRRTTCAQLIARFPVIVDYLRDGRVSTTSLCELREVLNEDTHRELLERASGLKEEEITLLAATLNPKAEVADSVRRVTPRTIAVLRPALAPSSVPSEAGRDVVAEAHGGSSLEPAPAPAATARAASPAAPLELSWVTLPPKPTEVKPLSGDRYSIRMSVSKEFMEHFDRAKSALSHVVPAGKMEDVLGECLRIALDVCERRTLGSKRGGAKGQDRPPQADDQVTSSTLKPLPESEAPATVVDSEPALATGAVDTTSFTLKPPRKSTSTRYIPAAVRRAVYQRDERCCTFVGTDGKRCRSTYQLQFNHQVPFARGGPPTADNLNLLCSRHNRHQAYRDFGGHMDRFARTSSERSP